MKHSFESIAGMLLLAVMVGLSFCTTCWAGPPPPPSMPSTPVGNAGVSAVTVMAVAAYGYWKMRR